MFKRSLLVLGICALALGCRPNANRPLPDLLTGAWSEIEASLPADLPFGLGEIDPDGLFELVNHGGGEITLTGLSELLPGALTDSLAGILDGLGDDAGALQDLLGVGDLTALIDTLESFFAPLIQPTLDLLGLGSLDDVLGDFGDLQALLDGFGGDLDALLGELLNLDGTLPDEFSCTLTGAPLTCGALACGNLSCEPVSHVVDLRPGVDAVLMLHLDVDGSFQGSSNGQLYITVDAECTGADCDAVLGQLPVELPFTYVLAVSDL